MTQLSNNQYFDDSYLDIEPLPTKVPDVAPPAVVVERATADMYTSTPSNVVPFVKPYIPTINVQPPAPFIPVTPLTPVQPVLQMPPKPEVSAPLPEIKAPPMDLERVYPKYTHTAPTIKTSSKPVTTSVSTAQLDDLDKTTGNLITRSLNRRTFIATAALGLLSIGVIGNFVADYNDHGKTAKNSYKDRAYAGDGKEFLLSNEDKSYSIETTLDSKTPAQSIPTSPAIKAFINSATSSLVENVFANLDKNTTLKGLLEKIISDITLNKIFKDTLSIDKQGNITFEATAIFNNPVTINDSLTVNGPTLFTDDVTILGDTILQGNTINQGSLAVTSNLTVGGNTTLGGAGSILTVNGATTNLNANTTNITGTTNLSGPTTNITSPVTNITSAVTNLGDQSTDIINITGTTNLLGPTINLGDSPTDVTNITGVTNLTGPTINLGNDITDVTTIVGTTNITGPDTTISGDTFTVTATTNTIGGPTSNTNINGATFVSNATSNTLNGATNLINGTTSNTFSSPNNLFTGAVTNLNSAVTNITGQLNLLDDVVIGDSNTLDSLSIVSNTNFNNNRVSGVASPLTGDQAANKAYVDGVVSVGISQPANEIIFGTGTGIVSDPTFVYNDTTNQLGIGTASPTEKLDVVGNIRVSGALMPNNLPGTTSQALISQGAGTAPIWGGLSNITGSLSPAQQGALNLSSIGGAINLTTQVTGQLPVANGGTGTSTSTGTGSVVLNTNPTINNAVLNTSTINGVTISNVNPSTTFLNGTGAYTTPTFAVPDGDKGDIVVSSGGTVWNLDPASGYHTNAVPGDWLLGSNNTSLSYLAASLELQTANFATGLSATAPRLAFHWNGVVASQIGIEASGRIAIRDNAGTAYESLIAENLTSNNNIISGGFVLATGNIQAGGDLISSIANNEGGNVTLVNNTKSGVGVGRTWKMFNMTAGYGNALRFYDYDSSGSNISSTFGLLDNGRIILSGPVATDFAGNSTGTPGQSFLSQGSGSSPVWGVPTNIPQTSVTNLVADLSLKADKSTVLSGSSTISVTGGGTLGNNNTVSVIESNILLSNLGGVLSAAQQSGLSLGNIGGNLSIAQGGTGATTAASARTNLGTNDASNITTGVLATGRGGTGSSATPLNGQIPVGNGTNYTPATITAGSNVTVTNGPGTITIAASGTSVPDGDKGDIVVSSSGTVWNVDPASGFHTNNTAGDWQLSSSNATLPFGAATLELRESNLAGVSGIAPRLSFHHQGVVASQIALEATGRIAIRNNPGTAYESFIAENITSNNNIISNGQINSAGNIIAGGSVNAGSSITATGTITAGSGLTVNAGSGNFNAGLTVSGVTASTFNTQVNINNMLSAGGSVGTTGKHLTSQGIGLSPVWGDANLLTSFTSNVGGFNTACYAKLNSSVAIFTGVLQILAFDIPSGGSVANFTFNTINSVIFPNITGIVSVNATLVANPGTQNLGLGMYVNSSTISSGKLVVQIGIDEYEGINQTNLYFGVAITAFVTGVF